MKKIIICLLILTRCQVSFAQSFDFKTSLDSLLKLRQNCIDSEDDSTKLSLNILFSITLRRLLTNTETYGNSFDTLKSIAILSPSDQSFRLFNWEVEFSDKTYGYYGMIQAINKKKKQVQVIELIDKSNNAKKVENVVLDPNNWYGAHYYKLIETKRKKKNYYTLLGANWSNVLIRKKIIDVISVTADGKVKFGDGIFQKEKLNSKRVIFQYASEVSMSLRYDENKKNILFDHLVPREPSLKGQYEFYGPDMSIDGYTFVKGKWQYKEDIDARNEKK